MGAAENEILKIATTAIEKALNARSESELVDSIEEGSKKIAGILSVCKATGADAGKFNHLSSYEDCYSFLKQSYLDMKDFGGL